MSFGERIAIKSRREIEQMREIGHSTAEILLEQAALAVAEIAAGQPSTATSSLPPAGAESGV